MPTVLITFPIPAEWTGEERKDLLLSLAPRDQCFMNPLQCSETMSTGKINCAKGKEKKKKAHIAWVWEVFLFCLVTLHTSTVFWATCAAGTGCERATGYLPMQGRRDSHGTWPTQAPRAPAQPDFQRTSGGSCLRDRRRHGLGGWLLVRGLW